MEEYINLFEKVMEKTIPKVDYIDIRAGKSNSTSILMKDGEIDEINAGMGISARIRVLNNGAWGFAYTTDLSKFDDITETALKLSNSLKGDVELSESEIVKDKIVTDVEIPFEDISIDWWIWKITMPKTKKRILYKTNPSGSNACPLGSCFLSL